MGKRQALAEYHRGSILAAAERLFAQKGTEGTTMDDIAREAEYSKATLYVYFESKEEIVGAILLNGLSLLNRRVGEAVKGQTDWVEAYDAVCQAMLTFYRENPAAYEAVMGAGRGADSQVRNEREIRRMTHELYRGLADLFRAGQQAGVVRADWEAMELVMLYWSAISGMIYMAGRNDGLIREWTGKSGEEFLADGVRLFLRAIRPE